MQDDFSWIIELSFFGSICPGDWLKFLVQDVAPVVLDRLGGVSFDPTCLNWVN